MTDKIYGLYDIVQMKKDHPCRKSQHFRIVRMGVDIKIRCLGCDNVIMLDRQDFERKLKKIIQKADEQ